MVESILLVRSKLRPNRLCQSLVIWGDRVDRDRYCHQP